MTELFINKAKTCAVTGHRILYTGFDRLKLKEFFLKIIEIGFDNYLIGMALGFDTECFNVLEEIRQEKPIKIIACIPCLNQDYKFNKEQKMEYQRMLNSADEKVYLSKEYTKNCMIKRNKYMVDNASLLVSYLKHDFGGSYNTVKYAEKQNVQIINFD